MKPPLDAAGRAPKVVRIWDGPVRLFHWAVVILIAAAWWTAQADRMQLHRIIGYGLTGLLLFRLWWGVFGGSTARFSAFVRGPAAVGHYAVGLFKRPAAAGPIGHNPMGGWSVVALLALMGGVVACGFFAVDVDGVESGPFADRVSFDAGRLAAHWHQLLFNGLLAFIALHVCAVAFYALVRRDNLLGPMLSGRGRASGPGLRPGRPWALLVGAALSALLAFALARGLKF